MTNNIPLHFSTLIKMGKPLSKQKRGRYKELLLMLAFNIISGQALQVVIVKDQQRNQKQC